MFIIREKYGNDSFFKTVLADDIAIVIDSSVETWASVLHNKNGNNDWTVLKIEPLFVINLEYDSRLCQ